MNDSTHAISTKRDRTREISVTRRFRASKELLLELWSDPAKLTKWWGPLGFTTTTHEIDFRSGGHWRFTMHGPDGTDYPNHVRYQSVGPDGLEYDHGGDDEKVNFHVIVTFTECGPNCTEMEFRSIFPSAEALRYVIEEYGAEEGLHGTISRLETLTEQMARLETAKTNTRQSLHQARDRFLGQLAMVPEDRLNWSPSPSARTAVEIAHHVGQAIYNLHQTMMGNRYSVPTMELADQEFRAAESLVQDREVVVRMITDNANAYDVWLDSLTYEMLDSLIWMPFDLGHFPLEIVLGFPAMHTNSHIPQLEYLQTTYGDRVWH